MRDHSNGHTNETTLMTTHKWKTPLMKDNPDERPPWEKTTLMKEYQDERPPRRETALMKDSRDKRLGVF